MEARASDAGGDDVNVSLQKARQYGVPVNEACFSDVLKPGQWIHRNDVIFAAPDLREDIMALWPDVRSVPLSGILTDVPETLQ